VVRSPPLDWGMPQKRGKMSQSSTTIIGNVTDDPKLMFSGEGNARINFSVAVNHYWTDSSGEKQEKTSYINVTAWRFLAEDSANVLEKGVGVIVTGRLEQRSWEDKETGKTRSVVEITADNIGILTRSIESFERKRRNAGDGGGAKKAVSPRQAQQRQTVPAITDEEEPF
jgi:single-strand DNA-binding protein